jgi:tape measure domain-containing protein
MSVIKSLEILLKVDNKMLKSDLARSERMIGDFSAGINKKLKKGFKVGALAVGGLVVASIKRAMDVEKFTVKLAALGGGADIGIQLRDELRQMALESPFQEDQFFETGARLLGAGVRADEVKDIMQSLGDVAAGAGVQLNQLALVFSQVFAKTKLQGEEMLQFMERNVSLNQSLQVVMGVDSAQAIRDLQAAGKIGIKEVALAFKEMTSEGGRFENGMKALANTTTGQFIKLFNSFNILRDEIGQRLLPIVNHLFSTLIEMFQKGELDQGIRTIAGSFSIITHALIGLIKMFTTFNDMVNGNALALIAAAGAAFYMATAVTAIVNSVVALKAAILALELGTGTGVLLKIAVALIAAVGTLAGFSMMGISNDVQSEIDRIENALSGMTQKSQEAKSMFEALEAEVGGASKGVKPGEQLNVAPVVFGSAEAGKVFRVFAEEKKSREVELLEEIKNNTSDTAENTRQKRSNVPDDFVVEMGPIWAIGANQ